MYDNNMNDKLEITIPSNNSTDINASAQCPHCQATFEFHCVKPGREGYSNGSVAYFGRMPDLMKNVIDIKQTQKSRVYGVKLECPYCGSGFDADIKIGEEMI